MNTRYRFLLVLALTSLWGCKKASDTPQVEAPFNTAFTLNYLQRAYLPTQASPELTVSLDDIADTRCPLTLTCLLAGSVQVTVGVRGQSGAQQVATLCLGCGPSQPDSAAVLANSRPYVLRATRRHARGSCRQKRLPSQLDGHALTRYLGVISFPAAGVASGFQTRPARKPVRPSYNSKGIN